MPINPHSDGILDDQDRQDDRGAVDGGNDKRDQGHGKHADASETSLAKAEKNHSRDGGRIEQGVGNQFFFSMKRRTRGKPDPTIDNSYASGPMFSCKIYQLAGRQRPRKQEALRQGAVL